MALLDVPGLPPLRADASGAGMRHVADAASAETVSDATPPAVIADADAAEADAGSAEADRKARLDRMSTLSPVVPA